MNSYFECNGSRFDLTTQSVSYSHSISTTLSCARRRQTVYAAYAKAPDVTIKVIVTADDYLRLNDFLRSFFASALNGGDTSVHFVCPYIGCDLNVIPPSTTVSFKLGLVATQVTFTCTLVSNNAVETELSVGAQRVIENGDLFLENGASTKTTYERFYSGVTQSRAERILAAAKAGTLYIYFSDDAEYSSGNYSEYTRCYYASDYESAGVPFLCNGYHSLDWVVEQRCFICSYGGFDSSGNLIGRSDEVWEEIL